MTTKAATPGEDFSGVKIVFDKPGGYTTGDTITAKLSGAAVLVKPARPFTINWPVIDPVSGNTGVVTGTGTFTEVDQDSVKSNGTPTDDAGHTFAVGADGISATATA